MRFLIPLLVFGALCAMFVAGLMRGDPTKIPSPLIDEPLPEFSLPSLADPDVSVTKAVFSGQPMLLNVWGSWCAQCGTEHEFLMRLSRQGIPIVGLNWNDEQPSARQWLQRLGDPYTVTAVDVEGRVAIDLGVYGAPETFLVDASGTIVHKHIGVLDETVWAEDFLPRLAQLSGDGS